MGLVVSPDLGVDGAAWSGGARCAFDPLVRLAHSPCDFPESLAWQGFRDVCWWSGAIHAGHFVDALRAQVASPSDCEALLDCFVI